MNLDPPYENDEDVLDRLLKEKSSEVQAFIKAQLFHKPNSKWNQDEKNVFLKMNYKSPSMYSSLTNMGFITPGKTTIREWYSKIPFTVGISDYIINIIKEKCEDMKSINKKCVLCFDEMSLKYAYEYDQKNDFVAGYEDFGGEFGRNSKPAKHALVFMLNGLNKQWKQVNIDTLIYVNIISYFF